MRGGRRSEGRPGPRTWRLTISISAGGTLPTSIDKRTTKKKKASDLLNARGLDPKFALAYNGLPWSVERVARFHGEETWIDSPSISTGQALYWIRREVRGYTELANALA